MTTQGTTNRSQGKERTSDDIRAEMRQVQAQIQACEDRVRSSDRRIQQVAEEVAAGWQGDEANRFLRELDDVHQSMRGRVLAQLRDLKETHSELHRQQRIREEDQHTNRTDRKD